MSEDTPAEPEGRLREKTVFLLACAGILLLLGLMLGLVIAKRGAREVLLQTGEDEGAEHALIVEGDAPRRLPVGSKFEVRATVVNAGTETLQGVTLSVGAHALVEVDKEGGASSIEIGQLKPGESRTLSTKLHATGPGTTSITARAFTSGEDVSAGRFWDFEVVDGPVDEIEYVPGFAMAVRLSMFGPRVVDPAHPFEVTTIVENSGAMDLSDVRLTVQGGKGLRLLHDSALDYRIEKLLPGPGQAKKLTSKFRLEGVARGQVHVVARDANKWVAGIGVLTVTSQSP